MSNSPLTPLATTRRVVLAVRPDGRPRATDFRIDGVPLALPAAGQVQVQVHYLSIDPMLALLAGPRPLGGAIPALPIGATIPGAASGIVIASADPRFQPGDAVEGRIGWQERANVAADSLRRIERSQLADALGALGLPGFTAWCGLRLAEPLAGRTLLVSGASGAVGLVAGQLARAAGARVIGIASGADKCRRLVEGFGFHDVVDRAAGPVGPALAEHHRAAVDIYFDNIGGDLFFEVMPALRRGATVLVCGLLAEYTDNVRTGPRTAVLTEVMARGLRLIGFSNQDHVADMTTFVPAMAAHLRDGTVRLDQDLRQGLEGAIGHIADLFTGGPGGKRLAQLA